VLEGKESIIEVSKMLLDCSEDEVLEIRHKPIGVGTPLLLGRWFLTPIL
jgi:hypothetical protein